MTFILKSPNSTTTTLIMLDYHFASRRVKLSTGEHIHPDDWNPAKHRPRASAPRSATLTKFLDRMEARVREVHLQLKAEFVQVTPEVLRQAILRDIYFDGKRESFIDFFDRFIRESEPHRKPGTMQVYRSCVKLLKAYHGAKDFHDISPAWFVRYQTYMENCRDEKLFPNGYSANYISKNVAIIREVMSIAKRQGLHRNEVYKNPEYKKPSEEVDTIYLTVDELMQMYRCELSEAMGHVRDRFLIGAFTGLRFSDSSKITLDSVRDGLIFDRNKKTGTQVVIPVHRIVSEILSRYPDGLPEAISNQKTNEYIKTIGRSAGITTPIERRRVQGGLVVTKTHEKCDLITSHTARRSFASNAFLAGIPAMNIMKITGHKTTKSFMKYIRITEEENARSLADHPFFK